MREKKKKKKRRLGFRASGGECWERILGIGERGEKAKSGGEYAVSVEKSSGYNDRSVEREARKKKKETRWKDEDDPC